MAIVKRFNVNREQATLDADIIENMSANDVSYDSLSQYDENTVGDKLSELESQVGMISEEKTLGTSDYSNLLWGGTTDGWLDATNKNYNSFIIPLYPNQTFTILSRYGTIIHNEVFDYRPQQGLKKNSIANITNDTYTNNSSNLVYITYGWIIDEVHTLKYKISGYGITEDLKTTIEKTDTIKKDLNDLDKIVKGVSPIKGVSFTESDDVNIVKNNLKSAWLEIIDSTFDLNRTCYMSVVINAESRHVIQCFTQKGSFDGNLCLSYVSESQAITEKEIVLNGYNTYKDKIKLHLVFDFANFGIHHFKTLSITMKLSDMHTSKIDNNGLIFEVEKLKDTVSNIPKPLVSKTIVCFGDSITEFKDENGKCYSDYLAELTGAEIINVGIGGTMLKQRKPTIISPTESTQDAYACLDIVNLIGAVNSNDFTNQELASNYLKTSIGDDNTAIVTRLKAIDWSKVDVVTFFAGTNDWWTGSDPFSDPTSNSITNSGGAVNTIITTFLNKYPTLKVFWFTPIVRWNPGNNGERTDENWSDNLKNFTKTESWQPEPKTLGEWSDSVESCVKKRHIPCCNLYWSLGWNQNNFDSFFSTTDGTHPTKGLGMKRIAETIASFILSMGL